jgi:hypothetical protein
MRMLTKVATMLAFVFMLEPCDLAHAQGSPPDVQGHWLMLVGTQNKNAAKEAAFNSWYDDIDIPDVLKVPGYQRARRGLRQALAGSAAIPEDQERYVALYDIKSTNIDRTIIDMLMASRKMDATGRSTDLLRVVERSYFRQLAPASSSAAVHRAGKNRYLYFERVACCRDDADNNLLNDWYDNTHLPDVMAAQGLVRATRYELYRVLMVEPKHVPHFLTVYEFEADSADQVLASMRALNSKLRESRRMSDLFVDGEPAIYLTIGDVKRM